MHWRTNFEENNSYYSPANKLACVASISMGFQSRERPKNKIFDNFAMREMEQAKNWSEGGGRNYRMKNGVRGRGKGNAYQQRLLF